MNSYIVLAYILFCKCLTNEIYSSTAHIKQALEKIRQDKSIEMVKKLLDKIDSDLTNMKRFIGTLDQLEAAVRDPNFTVHHPLDAYRFIRNHSVIYNETVTGILNEIQRNNQDHYARRKLAENLIALSKDDLIGALKGIIRIQCSYDLKTQELADGNVLGQYRSQMTAEECKDMMATAFYSDMTNIALEWFDAALQRIESGDETIKFTKLLCKAAACAYDVKSKSIADQISDYILKDNPKNRYLRHKMKYIQGESLTSNVFKFPKCSDHFRISCQNSLQPEQKTSKKDLFCSYIDNGHPFLRYQPGKVEILSLDPIILVFHDVLPSGNLSTLIEVIKPHLIRSTIGQNSSVSEDRTSKGMKFSFSGFVKDFNKYIGALTSLRWESFENLQIANYGIGGHYDMHHDSFNFQSTNLAHSTNDRIATFMIYLTDVEKGGATVFPVADVSVLPKAGNAVFWYNLNPDGSPCDETTHAACPVIIGDKYIGNIWIRERGQEFTRPCNLDQKDKRHKWPFTNLN